MKLNIQEFNTAQEQADYLAYKVADDLALALADKGKAVLCVPGGSTPDLFFQALSKKKLAWNNVYVVLNDERWVPLDDPLSNEALLRKKLLINDASDANIVSFYRSHDNVADAINQLSNELSSILPLDVCVLGMGEDGHTASLFPGSDTLHEGLTLPHEQIVLPVHVPGKTELRVTLTLGALLSAKSHFLLIKGSSKKHIAQMACQANNQDLPISFVFDNADLQVVYSEA